MTAAISRVAGYTQEAKDSAVQKITREFSSLLEAYVGPIGDLSGQTWRANLYKCADHTSHPNWASWSPIQRLSFHLPEFFGELALA